MIENRRMYPYDKVNTKLTKCTLYSTDTTSAEVHTET